MEVPNEIAVVELKHLNDHRFWVVFSDGMAGEWDYSRIKDKSGSMAVPLHAVDYVSRAFIQMGAPTWPNGWDVSPEALYSDLNSDGRLDRIEKQPAA